MDYPSENDFQSMQWSKSFGCDDDITIKQEMLEQSSMSTSDPALLVSGPMLQYPPYIDLNYSDQAAPRKSVSRAPSTLNQTDPPAPPFSFTSSSSALGQIRAPSRKRSDARLVPYPQQRPTQE